MTNKLASLGLAAILGLSSSGCICPGVYGIPKRNTVAPKLDRYEAEKLRELIASMAKDFESRDFNRFKSDFPEINIDQALFNELADQAKFTLDRGEDNNYYLQALRYCPYSEGKYFVLRGFRRTTPLDLHFSYDEGNRWRFVGVERDISKTR